MSGEHPITWVTAGPLWDSVLGAAVADPDAATSAAMRAPALVTFESDTFMDDFAALLARDPGELSDKLATPHSHRVRPPGYPDDWEPDDATPALKLYQAVHGHFNLVTATLCCQLPGLPDRAVHPESGDRTSFVLRRLLTHADGSSGELAWVTDPAALHGHAWQELADPALVDDDEERLPLFPLGFTLDHRDRRLFAGLIPASSREAYGNTGPAAPAADPTDPTPPDPRAVVLKAKFEIPATNLPPTHGSDPDPAAAVSPFIVLELAAFLAANVAGWKDILDGTDPAPPGTDLYQQLSDSGNQPDTTTGQSWLEALRAVWAARVAVLEQGDDPPAVNLRTTNTAPSTVAGWVRQGYRDDPLDSPDPDHPALAELPLPKLDPRDEARYVVRCVYERPQCGPLHDPVVSARSADFAIGSYFDLDAPAREIQIALPLDTSPGGLRKFRKNVSFVLSDQLQKQMSAVKGLQETLDGDVGGQSWGIGFICSFSIPIITLCAFFVLMIFLILLNIVFFWLPFFRICLPIPVKK